MHSFSCYPWPREVERANRRYVPLSDYISCLLRYRGGLRRLNWKQPAELRDMGNIPEREIGSLVFPQYDARPLGRFGRAHCVLGGDRYRFNWRDQKSAARGGSEITALWLSWLIVGRPRPTR